MSRSKSETGSCRESNTLIAGYMHRLLHGGEELDYHCSWDWLMPVVEKIEQDHYRVQITQNVCVISQSTMALIDRIRVVGYSESKLDVTYKAVVGFIRWVEDGKPETDPPMGIVYASG